MTFTEPNEQDAFLTALDAFEKCWQTRIGEGDDAFTLWEPSLTGATPSVGVARGDGEVVRVRLSAAGERPQWMAVKDGAAVDLTGAARLLGLPASLTQGVLDAATEGLNAAREAERGVLACPRVAGGSPGLRRPRLAPVPSGRGRSAICPY